jgi:hypothetical protein
MLIWDCAALLRVNVVIIEVVFALSTLHTHGHFFPCFLQGKRIGTCIACCDFELLTLQPLHHHWLSRGLILASQACCKPEVVKILQLNREWGRVILNYGCMVSHSRINDPTRVAFSLFRYSAYLCAGRLVY